MSSFLRQLVRGMAAATFADKSDRQLIELLLAGPDEAAFEALVRRHGPMVYRVCWRVLQQAEDSEDAFQATFLLLARKLATVRKRESLASWLHGVAQRVALDSKKQAARRFQREGHASCSEARPPDDPAWRQLRDALDTEISKLPEKHRLPLILCYLEGRSQEEAARQLGWSKSTLLRRLAEAREALGRRLQRKGFVVPAALAAILISESVAPAALSSRLVVSTATAAASGVAGPIASGLVSAKVTGRTKGALKAMFASKTKSFLAAALLGAAFVATGWVLSGEGLTGRAANEAAPDDKAPAAPGKAAAKLVVVRENAELTEVAWSADGKWVLAVSTAMKSDPASNKKILHPTATVKVWDARTGEFKKSLTKEEKTYIQAIAVSPDKKQVAIAGLPMGQGQHQFIKIFDAETWDLKLRMAKVGIPALITLAFSPDGKALAVAGAGDDDDWGTLMKLWDVQGQTLKDTSSFDTPTRPGKESQWQVQSLAFSPDGKLLASAEWGRESQIARLQLYDARTGEPKKGWEIGPYKNVLQIAFAADGKNLITASAEVKLWDVATGKELRTWDTKGWDITKIAVSPDGRHLAVGGFHNEKDKSLAKVLLFDVKTGQLRQTLPWLNSLMFGPSLAFSPDSRSLAICGRPDLDTVKEGEATRGQLQIIPLGR
jgi:RNA polymerase sigma factor (sigma-70 family)